MSEERIEDMPAASPSGGEPDKASVGPAWGLGSWADPLQEVLRIREDLPGWQRALLGIIPIVAIIGIWWFLTAGERPESRFVSPVILPSPMEVVNSFGSLWFDRALTRNALLSLGRVVQGFVVAVAIVFPLGLLMGTFSKVKALFQPLSVFGAYTPIPALVPLTLSIFGTQETQKVAFLALAFGIYLLPLIVKAVDEVDEVYLKTAYTLGASKLQVMLKVLLGVAWSDIYQALRLGFGIGWSYIILVEIVDIGQGLGGIIMISQRRGPREHIYLVLLVIVALAFITDWIWATAGKYLFPYREQRK